MLSQTRITRTVGKGTRRPGGETCIALSLCLADDGCHQVAVCWWKKLYASPEVAETRQLKRPEEDARPLKRSAGHLIDVPGSYQSRDIIPLVPHPVENFGTEALIHSL